MIDIALTAFVTLFVIIDPIGLTPIFVALTQGMDKKNRQRVALTACAIAFGVLALFGFAGERLLELVGIGMPAFRIAGGILLFLTAVDMLFERRTERREKSAEDAGDTALPDNDPSVFPLATPLIAGPGSMATMILLVNQQDELSGHLIIYGVMGGVILTALILFHLSSFMERILGKVGINVVTRLLGMLLAALSVQFVLDGLRDVSFMAN